VEDVRAVVLLCPRCHALHHGERILSGYAEACLPPLIDANLLWIKRERDYRNWDVAFLRDLWTVTMPEPAEPPTWFMQEYAMRRLPWYMTTSSN
jgi:hypothetical protein